MSRPWSSLLACCGLTLTACIAAPSEDAHGVSHFVSATTTNPADYAPVSLQPRTGGAAPAAPSAPVAPLAGNGTSAQPQPPRASPGTNAGMPAPMVSAGTSARAGAPAAVGGGAAGAARGAAGAPPAAGSPVMPSAGAAAPAGAGTLTLDFKSVNQGGRYAPQNVGAVWIATASGMFVKTLERWAGIRAGHLTRWNMASGGWGSIFGGGNPADQMDAVSRATLRSHGAHHVTWDMKDPSGKVVPDGSYKLMIEVTEDNVRAGAVAEIPFEKAAAPLSLTPPDKPPYAALTLTYQP